MLDYDTSIHTLYSVLKLRPSPKFKLDTRRVACRIGGKMLHVAALEIVSRGR